MDYINGYLNYTGSKYKLLEQILPEMDYSKKCFIDLFAGSFVVGANVVDKYDKILANDIIPELIGIHKKILNDTDIFVDVVKNLSIPCKTSQDEYNSLRKSFNEEKTPEKLYALMLSCTNNMMRMSKKFMFNQTWGHRCFNDSTLKKIELFVNQVKPYKDKIHFLSKHFNEVQINKSCMVYIDSPYTGSEAGYNSYWAKDDDTKLYDYCKELDKNGSSFMLSGILGEHRDGIRWELIDKLIADGYRYKTLDFNYEKTARIKNNKNSKEIIIMNYD